MDPGQATIAETETCSNSSNPKSEQASAPTPAKSGVEQHKAFGDQSATVLATIGILIFALNMFAAWLMAYSSWEFVAQSLNATEESAVGKAIRAVGRSNVDPNVAAFMVRIVESDVHLKSIANKQTIMMVAVAAGFGLLALGFSLFVMGMRGAMHLAGGNEQLGQVMLRSTSPGLVCFLLGAALIAFALSREATISFGPIPFTSNASEPPPLGEPPPSLDADALQRRLQSELAKQGEP